MVYVDRRNPPPSSENVTKSMKGNKGRGTKPELSVRKILRDIGFSGYRLNWKNAPGRPDIAYPGRKIAIFVNGCFWHKCPYCDLPLPRSHTEFWENKLSRNVERDRIKNEELESLGWRVLTIWECRLKKEPDKIREELADALRDR